MPNLRAILDENVREAAPELVEKLDRNRVRCFACGHRCPIPEGQPGRVQGALQPRRNALRAVGLRGRSAVRPDREETLLPRLSRRAGLQLRHAGLRPALRLLPELGDLAGAARSRRRLAAAAAPRRKSWCAKRRPPGRQGDGQHLQRAADHQRMGGGHLQGSASRRPGDRVTSPTATAPRRCSNICARGWISTRWT